MTTVLAPKPSARGYLQHLVDNGHLPAHVRLGLLALLLAGSNGHARCWPGQVAETLALSPQQTSRALGQARALGLIDPTSTSACVVLPGHALGGCEARHRQVEQ